MLDGVQNPHAIFDVYHSRYLKKEIHQARDKKNGVRPSMQKNTPIYKNFAKVLKVDVNKTKLFNLMTNTVTVQETTKNPGDRLNKDCIIFSNYKTELNKKSW